ncbi:MAG TPA: CDP-diacylglycerol--glycerol-3-phosphate 3-phosphatidyltransferase, partial [Plasticicumulans sp.]|nr:CDP-diacylglycerol--glycerol-3-phosphate 3-phosphatidyltransferase [Plasticicumulans sp.]
MHLTLPTWLTLARIAMVPVFVAAFFLPVESANVICTALFAAAAITDWLDGWLARRLGQTSDFGAFLDPVADKLMVAAALVLLVEADPTPWIGVPAVVIIGREIAISALREWMA